MEVEDSCDQLHKQKPGMARNNAGGFGWKVDDIQRLKRFLVLGSENGTYYTSPVSLGMENVGSVVHLITEGRGEEVVEIIKSLSVEGRCAKQDAIVYCLALCARFHEKDRRDRRFMETSQAAYKALPKVCRIPTHLFHFVKHCEEISKNIDGKTGWGRSHRRAIRKWYSEKSARDLAYQATKYKQRDGWSHIDLLRLCHLNPGDNKCLAAVLKFVVKGYESMMEFVKTIKPVAQDLNDVVGFLAATEEAKKAETEDELLKLISEHRLVREHIPTSFLSSRKIWKYLLKEMPIDALIKNLGKMSSLGMFLDDSEHHGGEIAIKVAQDITNEEVLKKARIHPFKVLLALKNYEQGKGMKGDNHWKVNQSILRALDEAFYLSFKFVPPTEKRYMLGIDVSGSMSFSGCRVADAITPAVAAAAMAMVTLKTEKNAKPMAFAQTFMPLRINKEMNLNQVMKEVERMRMGATDCALPMIYALRKEIPIDVFIIYTDCETWCGDIHPFQALKNYREKMGIRDARLIVCAMTSAGFTIADPDDPYMLDMVGFDSAAPEIISQFSLGEI